MLHLGGCHCGNLTLRLRLTRPPMDNPTRSCQCAFCRAHATRTVSDPLGQVDIAARDGAQVERYKFETKTADYLLCKACGVYIGAMCDTPDGARMVTNVNTLDDRDAFPPSSTFPNHDQEAVEARMARRAANWTPATTHGF